MIYINTLSTQFNTSHQGSSSPPLKSWKSYGFAIAIITGIGGLAVGGVGAAWYFGAISNLNQVEAIIMMAAGGGGGTGLFMVSMVGTVKSCKRGRRHPSVNGIPDTTQDFIKRTGLGTIQCDQPFGKKEWEEYFGVVVEEPALPPDIDQILNSQCPFAQDETIRVKHTHMLVLVPDKVNGEALTLNKLKELIENLRNKKLPARYNINDLIKAEYGNSPVERSHWVLMTRDAVPMSRYKIYQEQKEFISQYEGYSLPQALEAAVCILMDYVSYESSLVKFTYTLCPETVDGKVPIVVGKLDAGNLSVQVYKSNNDYRIGLYGAAALQRL